MKCDRLALFFSCLAISGVNICIAKIEGTHNAGEWFWMLAAFGVLAWMVLDKPDMEE